jgi:hypothetical protein
MGGAFIVTVLQIMTGLVIWSTPVGFAQPDARPGTLKLTIADAASGRPTPARVELLDEDGQDYIAGDALPVDGDCDMAQEVPARLTLERAVALLTKEVENPYTGTTQFYSVGKSEISLPPGNYKLQVMKGIEYKVQTLEVHIRPGETRELTVKMSRWINLPEQSWYSADDHIHIARPIKELNPFISKMMQAEDLHVSNLLQMGLSTRFHITLQYAHGPESIYREGDYILATGQENPRTHFLGHTITLGAGSAINFPEDYVIYRLFWEEARRQGALSGYAHFGTLAGAQYGLGIDLPHGLLSFLEVLQFNRAIYDAWYDILNTGFRLTPTAGTDYPCGDASIPGRERFFAKVEGPFTYKSWLEGVRRGRTFVTNGPILEFRVNGKGMGEELVLKKTGPVLVEGRVRFDPTRDDIERVEIIENGQLLCSFPQREGSAEIPFQFQHEVREASWLAVRAIGSKLGESGAPGNVHGSFRPTSAAHSAPIYVTLKGAPPLSAHPQAKALASSWLARLEDLETRLVEDQIENLAHRLKRAPYDIVEEDLLRKNRSALLKEIQKAKEYFTHLAR